MNISTLTDDELWRRTKEIAADERAALCDVVEHLAELDKRGLPKERGFNSLFEYCVCVLRCFDGAAYRRIRAARAIRLFPPILPLMRDGRLNVESVALLHPFLEDPDAAVLVQRAAGLRTWQVHALVAGRQTEKARRDVIRYVGPPPEAPSRPADSTSAESSLLEWRAPSAPAAAPQAPEAPESPPLSAPSKAAVAVPPSIRVAFTADADFHGLLRRAQALLRHKYPDGRLEGVLRDALIALLRRKDPGIRWAPAKGALARR